MEFTPFVEKLFARAAAQGIAECEVYFASGEEFDVSVKSGEVVSLSSAASMGLSFRALVGGRMGYASTQALDEEAVSQLVASAMSNAALIENDDEMFIFGGSDAYPELRIYNEGISKISAGDRIRMAKDLEAAALAADPRIAQIEDCDTAYRSGEVRIVNTKGLDVRFADNAMMIYVCAVAREGERVNTGTGFVMARDLQEIDIPAIARAAADEAIAGLVAQTMPSGATKVVLKSEAASALLGVFSSMFSADAAQKGMSLLKGREGAQIAAEVVTIVDDPLNPDGFGAEPFDAEGVATYKKAVVKDGVLMTLLHNLKTAAKQGVSSTGNASKGSYAASVGVSPANFHFEKGENSAEKLYEMAGNGVLITELQGLHSGANTISGDFSLSAKGVLIENGRLGRPVDQITLAGNFYELLKGVAAAGDDLRFPAKAGGRVGSPSLLVNGLTIAGE